MVADCYLFQDDLKLEEDLQTNRLDESLKLFNEITGSQWLKDRSFILFLNKSDLFKEKLKVSPLSDKFKDYTGTLNEMIFAASGPPPSK